jgi:hypothetical protein
MNLSYYWQRKNNIGLVENATFVKNHRGKEEEKKEAEQKAEQKKK